MKLSVNRHFKNKARRNTSDFHLMATGYENGDFDQSEMAGLIQAGYSVCAQHVGRRIAKNFRGSEFCAVDLDHGWTVEQLRADAYTQENAAFVYTTPSHAEHNPRLRVVFELSKEITDANELTRIYRGLARAYGGDMACTDPCRVFYGSEGCEIHHFSNILSSEQMNKLQTLGATQPNTAASADTDATAGNYVRSGVHIESNEMLRTSNGEYLALADMLVKTSVHCPVHNDRHASAFVTVSNEGLKGVHCCKCQQTFWPASMRMVGRQAPDFDQFIRSVVEGTCVGHAADHVIPHTFSVDKIKPGMIPFHKGVTMIKSPKGSGKTTWLKTIVAQCLEKHLRVLLIGHRQALIQTMADELGLFCYLEKSMDWGAERYDAYAVCVDSVRRRLKPGVHAYDVVLIDESEQVFSHLVSSTLDGKRQTVFQTMSHFIRAAESVILCDADLSQITYEALRCCRNAEGLDAQCARESNMQESYNLYVNSYKEPGCSIEIYRAKEQLESDLIEKVLQGGRYYVACNSKKHAMRLSEVLRAETGKRVMCITSDNSQDKDVREFLGSIKTAILEYDVLVASPSMGTGIDITFEDGAQLVDGVYGFFVANVNTHFDVDQQLARVRHPKFVKTWIANTTLTYETEVDAIKHTIIGLDELPEVVRGYNAKTGMPVVDTNDPLLHIHAHVVAVKNASKNNLLLNFIELKRRNGWQVVEAGEGSAGHQSAGLAAKLRQAGFEVASRHASQVCNAEQLDPESYAKLQGAMSVTSTERLAMERFAIADFYQQSVTEDLVLLDDGGGYRSKVSLMCEMLQSEVTAIIRSHGDAKRHSLDKNQVAQRRRVLHEMFITAGLFDGNKTFDLNARVSKDSLGFFIESCLENRPAIAHLFDISLRDDILDKPLLQLKGFADLIGLFIVRMGQSQKAYQRTIYYGLDPDRLNVTLGYAFARNRRPDKQKVMLDLGTPYLLNDEQDKVFLGPQMFEW